MSRVPRTCFFAAQCISDTIVVRLRGVLRTPLPLAVTQNQATGPSVNAKRLSAHHIGSVRPRSYSSETVVKAQTLAWDHAERLPFFPDVQNSFAFAMDLVDFAFAMAKSGADGTQLLEAVANVWDTAAAYGERNQSKARSSEDRMHKLMRY